CLYSSCFLFFILNDKASTYIYTLSLHDALPIYHYFELTNNKDAVLSKDILKKSFLFHVKYLILLFILGLTIIGLPAIWILIFSKGLVIGFSVGFIVNQLGWKGLLLAATS